MNGTERDPETVEIAALERDIDRTQRSLNRKLDEIGDRLQPSYVKEVVAEKVRERVNPDRMTGLAAVGLVATGTWLAIANRPRTRRRAGFRV